jgi:signal peptidase I
VTDEKVETAPDPAAASEPQTPVDDTARGVKKGINRTVVEWVVLVVAAIVIALVIKQFLFQAFYIPSRSMVPTLEVGDRVLVNKLSYDLHDVNRGDIVVFEAGPNKDWQKAGIDDLVKRVIALPGETVTQCEDNRLCIDGRLLKESYLPKGTTTDLYHGQNDENGNPTGALPGCAADSPAGGCTVPAGQYFVLGDNRSESSDARDHGPIKGSSIVGRVFVRIWPLDRLGFL